MISRKKYYQISYKMNDQLYIEVPVNYIYDQLLNEKVAY